jgi:hypothetical protein
MFQMGVDSEVVNIGDGYPMLTSDVALVMKMLKTALVHFGLLILSDENIVKLPVEERRSYDNALAVFDQVVRIIQRALWPGGSYWLMSRWPGSGSRTPMQDPFHKERYNIMCKSKFLEDSRILRYI